MCRKSPSRWYDPNKAHVCGVIGDDVARRLEERVDALEQRVRELQARAPAGESRKPKSQRLTRRARGPQQWQAAVRPAELSRQVDAGLAEATSSREGSAQRGRRRLTEEVLQLRRIAGEACWRPAWSGLWETVPAPVELAV